MSVKYGFCRDCDHPITSDDAEAFDIGSDCKVRVYCSNSECVNATGMSCSISDLDEDRVPFVIFKELD